MVLIKNMPMPEDCDDCRFNDCGSCYAYDKYVKIVTLRKKGQRFPDFCPLIAVEPYGPEGTLYKEK